MKKESLLFTLTAVAAMVFLAPAEEYLQEERVLWTSSSTNFGVYARDNSTWGNSVVDVTGHLGDTGDTPCLADLNGDGLDDRVVVRWAGNQFIGYCRYTEPDGSLPDVGISTQRGLGADINVGDSILFGNFNSDGINDTVMCRTSTMQWYVQQTAGSAGFATSGWSPKGGFGAIGDIPLYADINGDGFDDRVVVRADGEAWTTYVDYSIDGSFGDGVQDTTLTRGANATDTVAFSDINGDGLDDYILVRDNGDTFNLYGYYTYFDDGLSKYILGGAFPDIQCSGGDPNAGDIWLFGQMSSIGSVLFSEPFIWQRDPQTGYMVAQLTTFDSGNSNAFYWHQENNSRDGKYLVYRYMLNSSPSSLTYYKLNLETGENVAVTPTGLTNNAYVNDEWVYVITRPSIYDVYQTLSRYNLITDEREDILTVAGELGGITVNSDRSAFIYTEKKDSLTYIHLYKFKDKTDTVLFDSNDTTIRHFQFSLTDPYHYTYYVAATLPLNRVCVGRTDIPENGPFFSDDPYLISVGVFPHAFYANDGYLWCDAIWSSQGKPEHYIRFELDGTQGNIGNILGYAKIPIADEQWQIHTTPTRTQGWFGGDGKGNLSDLGELYIHLLKFDSEALSCEQHRLAEAPGTEAVSGNEQANNHVLETLDGIVWSAYNAFEGDTDQMNIFLVKIPNKLKAKLAKNAISDLAVGPWKHGNRVVVNLSDAVWKCDFGAQKGFGDGSTNQQGQCISSNADSKRFDLADINGDDVEDRVEMKWFSDDGGIWTVSVAWTAYSGAFVDNLPDSFYCSQSYNCPHNNRPLIFDDLDGDSFDDVVVLCEEGSSLYWNGILNTTGILPDATPSTGYANKAFGDAALDEFTFVADVNGDGYADRIVVRRHDEGWNWLCDYSNSEGFGDSSVDSSYVGANNSTDIPMVDDINGDGYADIVIARRENGVLKWYANLSSSSGFGGKWIWGPSVFGGSNDIPVIGHFTHYSTTESVCGDLGYPVGDIGGPGGEGIRDCKVDFYDLMVFVSHWLTGAGNQN